MAEKYSFKVGEYLILLYQGLIIIKENIEKNDDNFFGSIWKILIFGF